jgi:fructokinase
MLGAESALVSAAGKDEFAEKAINHLKNFGVATQFVTENDYPTGKCIVTVNNGIPSYNVLRPVAYDKIEISDDVIKNIEEYNADVFAFGTLIQRDEVSRDAVKKILAECEFPHVFCDVNLRPDCYDKDSCLLCLENADIIKISEEEESLLAQFGLYNSGKTEKETVKNICGRFENIKLVLFTKGENGSLIYDAENNEFYDIPCAEASVVSTVGAGDSYSAAFLCEYFKSGDILKSGKAGATLSAFVVSHREAVPQN